MTDDYHTLLGQVKLPALIMRLKEAELPVI